MWNILKTSGLPPGERLQWQLGSDSHGRAAPFGAADFGAAAEPLGKEV